jgi:ferric-chelate reductase
VVAGGSGISFALSVIQDLIQKDLKAESRIKVLELIWIVQNPGTPINSPARILKLTRLPQFYNTVSLTALLPNLTSLLEQCIHTSLRVKVFYTRAPTGKFPFGPDAYFHHRLTLSPGCPRFSKVLDDAVSLAIGLGSRDNEKRMTGMVVAVCGPTSLADDVVEAANGVEAIRRDQVGGIEIHEE